MENESLKAKAQTSKELVKKVTFIPSAFAILYIGLVVFLFFSGLIACCFWCFKKNASTINVVEKRPKRKRKVVLADDRFEENLDQNDMYFPELGGKSSRNAQVNNLEVTHVSYRS